MVPEGETGMKATETEAGRHFQTEMFHARSRSRRMDSFGFSHLDVAPKDRGHL